MVKKPLPTGEEPPKGYETLTFSKVGNELQVDFVMYNHLARAERAEVEALRIKAFERVLNYTGLSNRPLSIEREVQIIDDVEDSNRLLARAYFGNRLVGYALVILGWPERGKWLIQHMIIDPDERNQGVGSSIVKSIEQHALESELATNDIFAVPIQESGREFWAYHGYTVEASRFLVTVAEVDHELIVYHKAL